jgi:hypothetical protein
MENLALKIRLSVLWLVGELSGVVGWMLVSLEPAVIKEVMAGEIEGMKIGPELLLLFAIILLIPLVMAFLSLTLKDSTNRWANIILGIFYSGLSLFDLIKHLAEPSAYIILLGIVGAVVPALIAWYAYKWPRQEV